MIARPCGPDDRHCLAEEPRRAAAHAPDATFLRMMTGEWSDRANDDASTPAAHDLRRLGVTRGDISRLRQLCLRPDLGATRRDPVPFIAASAPAGRSF